MRRTYTQLGPYVTVKSFDDEKNLIEETSYYVRGVGDTGYIFVCGPGGGDYQLTSGPRAFGSTIHIKKSDLIPRLKHHFKQCSNKHYTADQT